MQSAATATAAAAAVVVATVVVAAADVASVCQQAVRVLKRCRKTTHPLAKTALRVVFNKPNGPARSNRHSITGSWSNSSKRSYLRNAVLQDSARAAKDPGQLNASRLVSPVAACVAPRPALIRKLKTVHSAM
jgi:hypothetical protein